MPSLNQISLKYGMASAIHPGHIVIKKNTGKKVAVIHQGGDKSDKYHDFLDYYEKMVMGALRHKPIRMLEIGLFEGRSLATFSDYFSKGHIVGLDISLAAYKKDELIKLGAFKNNNVTVHQGSSTKPTFLKKAFKPHEFDIILDDGDHRLASQYKTFNNMFYTYLKPGGVYIIEDFYNSSPEYQQFFIPLISKVHTNSLRGIHTGRENIRTAIKKSPSKAVRYIETIIIHRGSIIFFKRDY